MNNFENVDRSRPLKVFVGQLERERIQNISSSCGLSVSSYLKRVGLGYEPKPMIDHIGVLEMTRCRGELGRLGGLLKLWLFENSDEHPLTLEIRSLLNKIELAAEEVKISVLNTSA